MAARRLRREVAERGVYVDVCFGCGCLIPRDAVGVIEIFWGDQDPGRDTSTHGERITRAKVCVSCASQLRDQGGLVTRSGKLEVVLSRLEVPGRQKVRADKVIVVEGTRKVKP